MAFDRALRLGAAGGTHLLEEPVRDVDELLVFRLRIVDVGDRLDWAHRLAQSAVHTLFRLNVERALARIDAVNRKCVDVGQIFTSTHAEPIT